MSGSIPLCIFMVLDHLFIYLLVRCYLAAFTRRVNASQWLKPSHFAIAYHSSSLWAFSAHLVPSFPPCPDGNIGFQCNCLLKLEAQGCGAACFLLTTIQVMLGVSWGSVPAIPAHRHRARDAEFDLGSNQTPIEPKQPPKSVLWSLSARIAVALPLSLPPPHTQGGEGGDSPFPSPKASWKCCTGLHCCLDSRQRVRSDLLVLHSTENTAEAQERFEWIPCTCAFHEIAVEFLWSFPFMLWPPFHPQIRWSDCSFVVFSFKK